MMSHDQLSGSSGGNVGLKESTQMTNASNACSCGSVRCSSRTRTATPPCTQNEVNDVIYAFAILDLREDGRSALSVRFISCFALIVPHSKRRGHAPTYLIFLASLSITPRSAPINSARSVLFTMRRSLCVIPGPPFLGILSPPLTSMT